MLELLHLSAFVTYEIYVGAQKSDCLIGCSRRHSPLRVSETKCRRRSKNFAEKNLLKRSFLPFDAKLELEIAIA